MFRGCSSLTSTPEISCGEIGAHAFEQAFTNCASIAQAKDVSCDGNVWGQAFHWAFTNCTSLTAAPALPTHVQGSYVYEQAFNGCTGLQTASVSLQNYNIGACQEMFRGCTSLSSIEIQAPADPVAAGSNAYRCFYAFADGCSSLRKITVPFTKWDMEQQFTSYWLRGTASGLEFWCPRLLPSAGQTGGYNIRGTEYTIPATAVVYDIEGNEPLTFTAGPGGAEVGLQKVGSPPAVSLSWSKDGETWQEYNLTSTGNISLSAGESVQFKATTSNARMGDNWNRYHKFVVPTGEVSASGSLMSLLGPNIADQATSAQSCFDRLFTTCAGLKDASQLKMPHRWVAASATGSTGGGCASIFFNCTALTAAPELPLMEGNANSSWKELFYGCTGLSSVQPVISCYSGSPAMFKYMFSGCTSLTASPEFRCIGYNVAPSAMFYGTFQNCASLLSGAGFGDFTDAGNEAFRETFQGCTSLTSTPVLSCQPNNTASFYQAFKDCTSLRESNWSISAIGISALDGAFQYCSSLTSAPSINMWNDST